jgi:hypothetical protein
MVHLFIGIFMISHDDRSVVLSIVVLSFFLLCVLKTVKGLLSWFIMAGMTEEAQRSLNLLLLFFATVNFASRPAWICLRATGCFFHFKLLLGND